MPGSWGSYRERYWGSGAKASHFSHTDDSVPSALRCRFTCCQGTSGASRCRNVACFSATRPPSAAASSESGELRRSDEGADDVDVEAVGEIAERQATVGVGPGDLPADALRAE